MMMISPERDHCMIAGETKRSWFARSAPATPHIAAEMTKAASR